MAKEISGYVKLQVKGGAANPAPPVGPALGSKGVNIMEFCKQFNARTQDKQGKVVPVLITVYTDKSFDFVIKTAPAPVQLMEAAKIQKGSKESNRDKVGKVTWEQVEVIAKEEENKTEIRSLFFMNLGGYKRDEFEELHYKMLAVSDQKALAIKEAKESAFYKHVGSKPSAGFWSQC